MAGRILVLAHSRSTLGAYAEVLEERGDECVWIRCHEGEPVPETSRQYDGVISLGAPISVYDAGPPWLEPELRLLRSAVEADTPVWGICFGAQALAAALGARVWPGPAPEVGFHRLELAAAARDDPVFGSLPSLLPMFHWHGDSFDLPSGATLLAGSDAYPHQAFRAGGLAYGVQFHAEATPDLVRQWIEHPATRAQLAAAAGEGSAERLGAEAESALPGVNDTARALMRAWRDAAEAGG